MLCEESVECDTKHLHLPLASVKWKKYWLKLELFSFNILAISFQAIAFAHWAHFSLLLFCFCFCASFIISSFQMNILWFVKCMRAFATLLLLLLLLLHISAPVSDIHNDLLIFCCLSLCCCCFVVGCFERIHAFSLRAPPCPFSFQFHFFHFLLFLVMSYTRFWRSHFYYFNYVS